MGVKPVRGGWVVGNSLLGRMEGEILSKAALRSRRMRMVSKPESAAMRRSLVVLIRAVSVLLGGQLFFVSILEIKCGLEVEWTVL